eukprot:6960933-Prymnesium_polylepis.1
MTATLSAVTRTPLANSLMLGLSAAASAELSVLMPPAMIAAMIDDDSDACVPAQPIIGWPAVINVVQCDIMVRCARLIAALC